MKIKRGQVRIIVKVLYCSIVFLIAIFMFKADLCEAEEPVLIPEASHLAINEVYSNPVAMASDEVDNIKYHEWIELYNKDADDSMVDLSFYSLIKITSSGNEYQFNSTSLSNSVCQTVDNFYYVCNLGNDWLSNSGTTLSLRTNSDQKEIDRVTYGDTTAHPQNAKAPLIGRSITRIMSAPDTDIDNVDFVPANPTPGSAYEKSEAVMLQDKILSIENARALENGEDVMVTGTVTALPGVLSSQYFYIQDETGGIQVYSYGKAFPSLSLGDSISVSGELSQTNNERRIKISSSDKIIILNHTDPVLPKEITVSDIGEKDEGTYIKTAGIVTETSGDTFYISDGQSEIKVVINKSTGIDKPKMKKGDQVEVTGIVSQYKGEYRILPIDQDDVKIIASEDQLPRAGNGEIIYFIISLLSTIICNIYLGAKRKLLT